MPYGVINEEGAVAAAQFHFDRLDARKELGQVEPVHDVGQFEEEAGGGRCRDFGHLFQGKRQKAKGKKEGATGGNARAAHLWRY
jgi:hypothetical protein